MITPCIKVCKLVDRKCIGCGRTSNEIAMWSSMTNDQRKLIIERLKDNMENVTYNDVAELDEAWTDEGAELFFDNLRETLRKQEVTITFTKKDGTERVMRCTLDPAKLPVQENKETATTRKINTDTMSVFDLDAQGWRSFTKTSVSCVDFTTN